MVPSVCGVWNVVIVIMFVIIVTDGQIAVFNIYKDYELNGLSFKVS